MTAGIQTHPAPPHACGGGKTILRRSHFLRFWPWCEARSHFGCDPGPAGFSLIVACESYIVFMNRRQNHGHKITDQAVVLNTYIHI